MAWDLRTESETNRLGDANFSGKGSVGSSEACKDPAELTCRSGEGRQRGRRRGSRRSEKEKGTEQERDIYI
eukprot:699386-Pyramimonas_sp.AAC.1